MSANLDTLLPDLAAWSGAVPGMMQPPGRRFPTLIAPEGFEGLSFLTDEDKRIGVEIFDQTKMMNIEGVEQPPEHAAIQAINPYMLFQSDPALFARDLAYGENLSTLVFGMNNEEVMAATDENGLRTEDPSIRHRYRMAMLIVVKVAQEYKDEWTLRLMATAPGWTLSKQQFALLDQPHSPVWDEEERMILEFTHGIMHCAVNDELFARAERAWGRKQLLRYGAWVTRYISLLLFVRLNVADRADGGSQVTA